MTTHEQLELIKDWGPVALSIVGTVLTAMTTVAGYVLRMLWRAHTKRMAAIEHSISHLQRAVVGHEKASNDRMHTMETIVQNLRAEMQLAQQKFEQTRVGIMGCEANIKSQQNTIVEHIRELARIDSKFEAIFRFIDAKPRVTDVAAK